MITERDRLLAHYYDLEYGGNDAGLDFFVQYAAALDPAREYPVLELGCGTGRVALAIAEAGFRVTCVDISEAMLEVCSKLAGTRDVDKNVATVCADMCSLEGVPEGPYNLAFCALNTFAHLTGNGEQLSMLAAVKPLLVRHGILLLDLTPPWPHLLPPSDGEILYQGTYPDSDGARLHKLVTGHSELSRQMHHVTLIYDHEARDGALSRFSQQLDLRWTGRYEMEMLLKVSGYTVENLYGSYDLDDFGDDSERMIFVART